MIERDWVDVSTLDEMEAFYLSRLDVIRGAARTCGYAIGVHGSLRRDLDLIAVPWVADHADHNALARAIQYVACGFTMEKYSWEQKPAGRIAASFPICWTGPSMGHDTPSLGHIDLSVMVPPGWDEPDEETQRIEDFNARENDWRCYASHTQRYRVCNGGGA
jgi:hypothetical protein